MRWWTGLIFACFWLAAAAGKAGKCPPVTESSLPVEVCKNTPDECSNHTSCGDDLMCCSNGCNSVCTTPVFSTCEQMRSVLSSQEDIHVPACTPSGDFEPVQCREGGSCWCVDDLGFEMAGTREASRDLINCSAPRDCAGFLCRMLCPYGFALDDEGCPICHCRNPCDNFHCPDGKECQLEDIPCGDLTCPSFPTCKQPRYLEELCPAGTPLASPETGHPFLCGTEPSKPQCPASFLCEVQPGNDYGVCCPLLEKPGECPSSPRLVPGECPQNCTTDMECEGVAKCCQAEGCSEHVCLTPGNTTLCLQQKAVVELLRGPQADEKQGYIPQCDPATGKFEPRQCSLNGRLCWCVDPDTGSQVHGSMAPASSVDCMASPTTTTEASAAVICKESCDMPCKSGYKRDTQGCALCECNDPCEAIQCPEDSECMLIKMEPCLSDTCLPIPTCHRKASAACSFGSPLVSNMTGDIIICQEDCPAPFTCEIAEGASTGVCCPQSAATTTTTSTTTTTTSTTTAPPIHGEPISCPEYIPDTIPCDNSTSCVNDGDCSAGKLCCISQTCGPMCVAHRLPTMCEYLREMSYQLARQEVPQRLALPVPHCAADGSYLPRQCDQVHCWCVDDFGTEMRGSKVPAYQPLDCSLARERLNCQGLVCRLGCDYGFEVDDTTGCPLCDCRDPCKSAQCSPGEECRVVEAHCRAEWCPPVPLCLPEERAAPSPAPLPSCPVGSPMMFRDGNLPVTCDPYSKYQQCPDTHTCVLVSSTPRPEGVCCPHYEDTWSSEEEEQHHEKNIVVLVKNGTCPPVMEASSCDSSCDSDEDCEGVQKCCLNSCGTKSCLNPQGVWKEREGQCPYLLPHRSDQHCSVRCSQDEDCSESGHKCCSTGCGTACAAPLNLTHCQHARMVALHAARELGIAPSRTFHPACDPHSGEYQPLQCDPRSRICWCVSPDGRELPGTRSGPGTEAPDCSKPPATQCPIMDCNLPCEHGFMLDDDTGCPRCQCYDPCQSVTCSNPVEECHMVQVRCSSEPCPPLPLCVPRAENPCLNGEPLPDPASGAPLRCGPTGSQCPASHQCQLSPLGEFAVCCPKPRDVCYEPMSSGPCDHFSTRWHYNRHSNQCERFTYGGCGGTANNFETREQCMATCAVLSSCQRTRQHNLKLRKSFNRVVFLPKCNKKTHEWEPVQCLESVGLCWCVTPQGDQIPGTVVRGMPHCNARSGRTYTGDDPLCEDGRPAHVCPPDLCEGKVCLAYRNSTCRVNPCGGCHAHFYNEFNRQVDCDEGLSACHTELQSVVNSLALSAHRLPPEDVERVLPPRTTDSPPMLPPPPPYPMEHHHDDEQLPLVAMQDDDLQAESSHISVLVIAAPAAAQRQSEVTLQLPSLLQRFLSLAASTMTPAVVKPGSCPPQGLLWCASGSQPCHRDDHCPGDHKCCAARCGHSICSASSYPSQEPKSLRPPYMVIPLPICSSEGGFAVTQRQEDLSWCVDELGNPLHNTLTRGDVICDHNGTILHRDPIGPVCPDGTQQPRVCKTDCLSASCHLHPEAICVADPCQGCQVTFVNLQGEKVDCQGPCQEPARVRPCPDLQTHFYFNQSSQRCEALRGGRGLCLAGPNQFSSREDCQSACVTPVPVCQQPREIGMCRAQIPRWSYNPQQHQCEPFYYGGCGGNDNNFESKSACEARCPDLVMCPWATITGRYDVEPCSRTLACAGATCPGHPDALCTADPCTCEPAFVDSNGEPLDCDTPATETPPMLVRPSIPEVTRCQSLRQRYEQRRAEYIPQCDTRGAFLPMQCPGHIQTDSAECWCVNEAGLQLPDSFPANHTCQFVKVSRVDVTLAFQHTSPAYASEMMPIIKHLVSGLLRDLGAEVSSPELQTSTTSDSAALHFSLVGPNNVHVAFLLEEMVRSGATQIQLPEALMAADFRKSHFYHVSEYTSQTAMVEESPSVVANRVHHVSLQREPLVLAAAGALVAVLGLLWCLCLANRKKAAKKDLEPKPINLPMFSPQAFSSLLYNLTGKKDKEESGEEKKELPSIATIESQFESLQVEDFKIPEPPPLYKEEEDKH